MAAMGETSAAIRIGGDDLDPVEVTDLLGHEPTLSQVKGQEIGRKNTGAAHFAKIGQWHLNSSNRSPGDLDAQIEEIFSKLTQDLSVWHSLTSRFKVDLFCGLFLNESNEGISLSPASLATLSSRGVKLDLCIYSGDKETPNNRLEPQRHE
jgi:hypothetical protein